jgi:hypothetical protein
MFADFTPPLLNLRSQETLAMRPMLTSVSSLSVFVLIVCAFAVDWKLHADELRKPGDAVAGLDVADGLEVTLIAAEPLLLSPSNIDVDHLGRIWICEVVNYRHFANKDNPAREAGDRILVLEDTDGDGVMDKQTTLPGT